MPFPLIPVALGAGTLVAWFKVRNRKKKITPERKKTFEDAMKNLKDSDKMNALADTFESQGYRAEAAELRKRAKILALAPEKKQEYRAIAKTALQHDNPNKVKAVADAFHKQGFYGTAKNLKDYANGLPQPRSNFPNPVTAFFPKTSKPAESKPTFAPNVALSIGEETNAGNDSDTSISNDD